MGTLTQKTNRQPAASTNAPPTTGPIARLMPLTPPHTPIARARSRGSVNVFVMIDTATGLSIEPPTACNMRKAISHPRLGASPHNSELTVKMARPVWNMRRRPYRSAVAPESISSPASTRTYASTVHWRPDIDAPRSRPIEGSATLTIVLSSPTMNKLMQQVARMTARRRGLTILCFAGLMARSLSRRRLRNIILSRKDDHVETKISPGALPAGVRGAAGPQSVINTCILPHVTGQ